MSEYPALHMIIGGEQVTGGGRRTFDVVNPATGELLGVLPLANADDLDRALANAAQGFQEWRYSSPAVRARVLNGAARLIADNAAEFARIITLEQGKTLALAKGEVAGCVQLLEFFAGETFRNYGRELVRPVGQRAVVRHEPVGPVAAFAPWNFPFNTAMRKVGAAIAAGCSIILKGAEETPASALGILRVLKEAGLPDNVAQAVFGVPDEVSRHLLASPVIRKLSFTGSTTVGKHLIKLASENLIRTTMELGGHGPVLVFDDVDLDKVVATVTAQKLRNAGQVCIAPTRFIVQESIYEKFRKGMSDIMAATRIGDGMDPKTQMGPLANPRRLEAMDRFVADARERGARVDTGGERIGNRGFFFQPTVLSDVPPDAAVMNEEPFGPLALVNSYPDEDAMIAEANRLPFGLSAYSWTNDVARQRRLAAEIEAGMVGINVAGTAAADSPFGGVKASGHGSEDGPEGVRAYMVTKTVTEA